MNRRTFFAMLAASAIAKIPKVQSPWYISDPIQWKNCIAKWTSIPSGQRIYFGQPGVYSGLSVKGN